MKASFALPAAFDWSERSLGLPARLSMDFDGAAVSIAATSDGAVERLRQVYHYFLTERGRAVQSNSDHLFLIEAGTNQAAELAVRLGRRPSSLDGHILLASWLGWGLRLADDTLLHYYASKVLRLRTVERWHPRIATFHAASIAAPRTGGGFLLIGEAAAGKTTMTLRFIAEGFRYAADDTSCIRHDDLVCVPFPMAFVVGAREEDGLPAIPALQHAPPDLRLLDEPRWLFERREAVATAFQPDTLYFLDRDADGPSGSLQPLRRGDAALSLLRNLVMPLGADGQAFGTDIRNIDLACRLAEACRCLRVNTSDLDHASDAILSDVSVGETSLARMTT